MTFVVVNGIVVSDKEAVIAIRHSSFHLGLGVFTTARVYQKKIAWLEDHLHRLQQHSKEMEFAAVSISKSCLYELVQCCCTNDVVYKLKIIVVPEGDQASSYFAFLEPYHTTFTDAISLQSMIKHDTLAARVKTISYADKWIARNTAKKQGYDDMLFVNYKGSILETSCANIFWKVGNTVYFPKKELPLLWGIAIQKIQRVLEDNEYSFCEVDTLLDALPDEAVLYAANSMIQFRPVVAIDGKKYGRDLLFEKLLASGLNSL